MTPQDPPHRRGVGGMLAATRQLERNYYRCQLN